MTCIDRLTATPHVPHRLSVSCDVIVPVSPDAFALSADHIELRGGRVNGLGDQVTSRGEETFYEHMHVLTDLNGKGTVISHQPFISLMMSE